MIRELLVDSLDDYTEQHDQRKVKGVYPDAYESET